MRKLQYILDWISTRKNALHLILMILILSSLENSTSLSAFPSLKPSSIDNKYDIPIGIPIETSTTDPSINSKANLQDTTHSLESSPEEQHRLESTVSPLATCEKLPATSATASGNDGNIPSNVIDNNLNTRWSNLGQGSWIQLDLGSKKSICSVDIAWYRGDIRQNNLVISVSDDGTTFIDKLTKTSNLGTAAEKYTLLGGTEGRYVRITVNGNTENDWASINEISVFGGDIGGGGGDGGDSNVIGTLFHKWQTSAGGSTWSPYSSLSGDIAPDADLAIAMNNDGRLQVFVVGTNNQLYYKTQSSPNSNTWSSAWTSLGGGIKADTSPAVARNSDGMLQVFVVGTNNQLQFRAQTTAGSSTWSSAWTSLGGGLRANTDPIGIANNDGKLQVFVVGTNNQLYYKTQSSPNSNTWSSAWTSLGGGLRDNNDPAVVPNANSRLDAFVVAPRSTGPPNPPPTSTDFPYAFVG
ncbi:MAG: discoidin domain-containing protein, partial [Nitrososphaeraceae archaeon]